MAANVNFFLLDRQRLTGSDTQLFFDQVNAGDHFSNRVFYLNTGVHFDEIELAVFEQELESTCTAIADINTRFSATFADVATQFRVMPGAGASSTTFWWRRCMEQSRSAR